MNNFVRYYNQNRKMIWIVIFIIIFIYIVIQLLNNFYKRSNEREEVDNTTSSNTTMQKDYTSQSQAMVQGSISSEKNRDEFASLVDNFLEYCTNGQVTEAYSLLSNDCKELVYPSEKSFEQEYYATKFNTKKNYDFQLWSAVDSTYIYLVRIFDDMLSTGRISDQNYIQDYVSVIQEDNVYRLNIGGYIKTKIFQGFDEFGEDSGVFEEVDNIRIMVRSVDSYMDYETYHLSISNYSENDILLSPTNSNEFIYLIDESENNIDAMLFELTEDDLMVASGETKSIDIRFSRSYSTELEVNRINFDNIIKNYGEFLNLGDEYKDTTKISIEL